MPYFFAGAAGACSVMAVAVAVCGDLRVAASYSFAAALLGVASWMGFTRR